MRTLENTLSRDSFVALARIDRKFDYFLFS